MAESKEGLTPMMKQFYSLKEKHPDAVLLFRCGDFYETYAHDAVIASEILGITLTRRNNGKNGAMSMEMAGFPHHALDAYLPKLIRAGRRVAICDQLEDPKLTKTLVKRDITELVTPGVAMSDNVLQNRENNFLCALFCGKAAWGISFLDISTGEFMLSEGPRDHIDKLLTDFAPKETLIRRDMRQKVRELFGPRWCYRDMDDWVFTSDTAREKLCRHFKVRNLKGFGVDHLENGKIAAGAILEYLAQTLHNNISHITSIQLIDQERYVRLDKYTVRNLELLQSGCEDGVSLLDVIDRTSSPMGARQLRRWMLFPLKNVAEINARLDVVDFMFRNPDLQEELQHSLSSMGDVERLISKAAACRINPREVLALGQALSLMEPVCRACRESGNPQLAAIGDGMDLCPDLCHRILSTLNPDAPMLLSKGGVIAQGVSDKLDEYRQIAYNGKDYLMRLQQKESENTGIPSLKIAYNNVFGYYLEVRNTFKDRVPETWIRKQTLVNAERYITPELKEFEDKILSAEDEISTLESQLFAQLAQSILEFVPAIQNNAALLSRLDCMLSFAQLSREHRYVRPVVDDSHVIDIRDGRHPVIETRMAPGESFIANDVLLDSDKEQILIITGPNMAGKSALLRQTALIVLMAQMGCYVPAQSARIGMVDRIFTRVGASDNISAGESTFMVEMTEASSILNNLSPRSLVLFDELGRGTSTYDGISIAWAIVEYIHNHPVAHARTLFATHYHELNEMARSFCRIRNFNVSVKEVEGKVLFMRKLVPGGSEHSFGIHVAQLAGMPPGIVKRAGAILKEMESGGQNKGISLPGPEAAANATGVQMSFFQLDDPVLSQIRDQILSIDVNNLTPVEALNKLNDIKTILKGR